jgi:hypothetical protein
VKRGLDRRLRRVGDRVYGRLDWGCWPPIIAARRELSEEEVRAYYDPSLTLCLGPDRPGRADGDGWVGKIGVIRRAYFE